MNFTSSRKKHGNHGTLKNGWKDRLLRLELLEARRLLAVFSVSNLDDAGAGSLRDAITTANSTSGADEIEFSVTGTIDIASQLPTVSDSLLISGPGADLLTIDAGNGADNTFATGDGYRIFLLHEGDFNNEIDVEIRGLSLTGGDTANGSLGNDGSSGGAIFSRENLTLIDSVVSGNATGKGGDPYFVYEYPYGGGFYLVGGGGDGGGIFSNGGNLTVTGSTISGNRTGFGGADEFNSANNGRGGGIASFNGNLTVTGSKISGNMTGSGDTDEGFSGHGGGIFFNGGSFFSSVSGNLMVLDSTISGNNITGKGGGIYSRTNLANGTASFVNSTISGNSATDRGGGIYNDEGLALIEASTITANTVPNLRGSGVASHANTNTRTEISNSIIAGNTNKDLAVLVGTSNSLVSNGYNLIGSGGDFDSGNQNALDPFTADGTNLIGVEPLLGALADNGGPTLTHALLAGSPAIDAGDSSFTTPPEFDQRGDPFARVIDGGSGSPRVDIGAFEVQSTSTPVTSADFDTDNDVDGADFLAWQRGFGTPMPDAVKSDGDADDDLDVDADDLAVWEGSFGMSTPLIVASTNVSDQQSVVTAEQARQDAVAPLGLTREFNLIDTAFEVAGLSDFTQQNEKLELNPVDSVDAAYEVAYARDEGLALSLATIARERNSLDLSRLPERVDGDTIESLFDEFLWSSLDWPEVLPTRT